MSAPSIGSLALVADDPLAPRVIAWWQAKSPTFADAKKDAARMVVLLKAGCETDLSRTIERCTLAGLIHDDGSVSEIATNWLNHIMGLKLGFKPTSKPKAKPKPPTAKPAGSQ